MICTSDQSCWLAKAYEILLLLLFKFAPKHHLAEQARKQGQGKVGMSHRILLCVLQVTLTASVCCISPQLRFIHRDRRSWNKPSQCHVTYHCMHPER